jgi:hypothetical protein
MGLALVLVFIAAQGAGLACLQRYTGHKGCTSWGEWWRS